MAQQQNQTSSLCLLQQTEDKIRQTEKAISSVKRTKDQLKNNALEAKSQVRSAVSRQMESLRNREVWLLDQVELLQQTKEELLRKQEDQLQRCLGSLQNSLEYCQETTAPSSSGLKRRLSESLEKLDDIEMYPVETAHVSFKSDAASLREAIRKFGHVSSKVVPLEGAFVEPEAPSASLPRTFEDYEDAEHHVLYKTVEEIRQQKWNYNDESAAIKVKIPRLSDHVDDWLMPGSSTLSITDASTSTSHPPSNGPTTLPNVNWNLSRWRSPHQMKTPASIQQWLHDIQHNTECEEEDFEVVSATPSKPESVDMVEAVDYESKSSADFPYFKKVFHSPDANWIALCDDENDNAKLFKSLPGYQLHQQDHGTWLMETDKQEMNEVEVKSVSKCCAGTCTPVQQHVLESLDIENLDRLNCLHEAVTNYFTDMATDKRTWLKTSKKCADDDADVDEMEYPTLQTMCKANEPCQSIGQCVSDDQCCTILTQPNSSVIESAPSMFKGIQVEGNNWLLKKNHDERKFKGVPDVDNKQWLVLRAVGSDASQKWQEESRVPLLGLHQTSQQQADEVLWLLQSGNLSATDTYCADDPFFKHFQQVWNSNQSTWLKNNALNEEISSIPKQVTLEHIPHEKEHWLAKLHTPEKAAHPAFTLHSLECYLGDVKTEDWLLNLNGKGESSTPISDANVCSQFYKLVSNVDWLQKDSECEIPSKTELQNSVNNLIQGYQNGCSGKNWLMKAASYQEAEQDDSEWLLRKESSSEKLQHIGKQGSASTSDLAEWLMHTHI